MSISFRTLCLLVVEKITCALYYYGFRMDFLSVTEEKPHRQMGFEKID